MLTVAVHILPLTFEGVWNDHSYNQSLTTQLNEEEIK
jgi:hypothetical protein